VGDVPTGSTTKVLRVTLLAGHPSGDGKGMKGKAVDQKTQMQMLDQQGASGGAMMPAPRG